MTEGSFREWIYSFHMPLFFFLAGAVVSLGPFKTFIRKKIKGILLPYLLYGIVLISFDFIQFYISGQAPEVYKDVLFRFFIFARKYILWFLPCLFCTNILFWIFMQIHRVWLRRFCIVLTVAAVFVYYSRGGEKLPWSLDTSCIALLFFYLGYEYKIHRKKWVERIEKSKIQSIVAGGILLAVNFILNRISIYCTGERLDMNSNWYGVIWLSIPAALAGILFVLVVSSLVDVKGLSYIGKNSMTYYALHYMLITILSASLWRQVRSMINANIPMGVYVIVDLLICILLLTLVNIVIKQMSSFWENIKRAKNT